MQASIVNDSYQVIARPFPKGGPDESKSNHEKASQPVQAVGQSTTNAHHCTRQAGSQGGERLLRHAPGPGAEAVFSVPKHRPKRLWLLWQHGLLKREFLPVVGGIQTSPVLYLVDGLSAELLRNEFSYDSQSLRWSRGRKLAHQFLEHTLGLSEIRLAVTLSCRLHGYELNTILG